MNVMRLLQPEQRHAGKVGLGPNISTGTSITDKIKGVLGHHHTHEDHVRPNSSQLIVYCSS